jgi:hypothetical protein
MADEFGRTPITDAMRQKIADTFTVVPEGKRGALVLIADDKETRAVLAARINDRWKVAGGGGWVYAEKRPAGFIGIEAAW